MKIRRYKQSQRFRIIVDTVSFYTTAKQIRNGIGDFSNCNAATQKALDALEFLRSGKGAADRATIGISGQWENIRVQLDAV